MNLGQTRGGANTVKLGLKTSSGLSSVPILFMLLGIGFILLLSLSPLNPNIDGYIEKATNYVESGNAGDSPDPGNKWIIYVWIVVGSVYLFGASPLPLVLLNLTFLGLAAYSLLRVLEGAPQRLGFVALVAVVLFPDTVIYVISPSKDSIVASCFVIAVALSVALFMSGPASRQMRDYVIFGFAMVVLALLRSSSLLILGLTLLVLAVLLRFKSRFSYAYFLLPILGPSALYVIGREISKLLGAGGSSAVGLLATTASGYAKDQSTFLESHAQRISPSPGSMIPGPNSVALALAPDGPLETVVFGVIRAPFLLLAPFGSPSALDALSGQSAAFLSVYWAHLVSAVILLSLLPFILKSLLVDLRSSGMASRIQLISVAGITTLVLTSMSLPMIHERYRLPATALLAFSGAVTLLRSPQRWRSKIVWLISPVVAGAALWLARISLM